MKVLVAYRGTTGSDHFGRLMPVGVPLLVAVLRRAGLNAAAANFTDWDEARIERFCRTQKPDLLALSMMTHNRVESVSAARAARRGHAAVRIIGGGPHATHRYRELLLSCDALDGIVLGEGEETLAEAAARLRNGGTLDSVPGLAVRKGRDVPPPLVRPPIEDLDHLPFAAEGLSGGTGFDPHDQAEFIISSRGCPASCRFCSSPRFWRSRLRFRSPASMVEEIRYIRDRYGLIYFSFRDDTFTADADRVADFCRLLQQERLHILWNCQSRVSAVEKGLLHEMKSAGCEAIQLGIESGSPRILEALGKLATPEQARNACGLVRAAGIDLSIYLITGVEGEGQEDVDATCALLRQVQADDGQVSPLVYYPGTALFADSVRRGTVSAALFEETGSASFQVRTDPFVSRTTKRLLQEIERRRPRLTAQLEAARQQQGGFTFAGWLRAAERFRDEGNFRQAEKFLREIVQRQAENPWGWLGLAELFLAEGRTADAERALDRLLCIVPAHLPAYDLLMEVAEARGDAEKLKKWTKMRGEVEQRA